MAFHPGRADFVLTERNMHNESDSWYSWEVQVQFMANLKMPCMSFSEVG
jgi:hypothetical protein